MAVQEGGVGRRRRCAADESSEGCRGRMQRSDARPEALPAAAAVDWSRS
jgi:hypothetical protein